MGLRVQPLLSLRQPLPGWILTWDTSHRVWSCSQIPRPFFCPGSGMLNSHSHTMTANGEMNGGHSSQTMVSGSHCTPPPPYHADPSLVRCVGRVRTWACAAPPLPHLLLTVGSCSGGAALLVALFYSVFELLGCPQRKTC